MIQLTQVVDDMLKDAVDFGLKTDEVSDQT